MKATARVSAPTIEVLIAEDSPTQAEQLRFLLEENGYKVACAANGKAALAAARRRKPALVVSDVVMPEMDGYTLCREIKSSKKLADVPVILLTSLSSPNDVIRGLACGADSFIRKPYTDEYLLSRIDYILTNRELRKAEGVQMGIEIELGGQKHFITSERQQILDLLISTYEDAVHLNHELTAKQMELEKTNQALQREIQERKRAEEETRKLNAQLTAANKELEAFSYSVSHDLRAPLRTIDGFSQALLEEYGAAMDEQARQHLGRVRAAARRMGELIEDLLRLARVSSAEMRHETVNLSGLAETVAAELRASAPERRVEFAIQPGLTAEGDRRLLRVALENLLGNAWKFTGKNAETKIEFGMTERRGKRAYFVRDNGAGFDMAYAERLFGAFQRLHNAAEFPGTGIGLATVQRIINRHGGELWAEAAVGKGATFYFTL
ncbi:MAG TPA: response regulator [Candidatus Acidoferrales bacterium]|nr:response regulator [Candidatus Acidoferrales bacterium]